MKCWGPFEVSYDEFIIDSMLQASPGYWFAIMKNPECYFHSRLMFG